MASVCRRTPSSSNPNRSSSSSSSISSMLPRDSPTKPKLVNFINKGRLQSKKDHEDDIERSVSGELAFL